MLAPRGESFLIQRSAGLTRGSVAKAEKTWKTDDQVSKEKKGKLVDSRCRDLTSAFACEKGRQDPGSVPLCSFHEVSFPGCKKTYIS